MMMVSSVVLVAIFSVVAAAVDVADLVRMEPSVTHFLSAQWQKEIQTSPLSVIKASFVLKKQSAAIAQLEKELVNRSTPSNVKYGQWLSRDEVKQIVQPSETAVQAVTDFISSTGVSDYRVSKMKDIIHVTMPIEKANKMFHTEFGVFRSILDRNIILARIMQPYYLPKEIAEHVLLVDDILRFPSIRSSLTIEKTANDPAGFDDDFNDNPFESCGTNCAYFTTPAVLGKAYGYPKVTKVADGASVSVAEFQYQYYDNSDLEKFSKACGVNATVEVTIPSKNIEGVCDIGCTEALLDIEYIGSIVHPLPLTVIYSTTYSLLDWINGVLEMENPPLVHSVSYGNDEVQQTSVEYMESCNSQFMAAGAMGLSILFASGDQGVWGRSGVGKTFHPDFPAASPYVTAVGGTNFLRQSSIGAESAWNCGGGGFSDTFAMPSWQTDVVTAYLASATKKGVLPDEYLFNASGRAYPDVAALGGSSNPYCVEAHGRQFGVAGTSASCPVVAGIFAQLNNNRLLAGKSSLGWLNPLIYANPRCFNDVEDGENNCTPGTKGFSALTGWDPATGMGSPIYSCLEKVTS